MALETSGGRRKALLQLLRLPTVFTAMADIFLGFLLTHERLQPLGLFLALLGCSTSVYLAGMVLNDVYDLQQDLHERPDRPLPSGRVSLSAARLLGFNLLLIGLALGWFASALSERLLTGAVATALAALVWSYDAWLKRTPLGPLAMGGCRTLNVLLGASAVATAWPAMHVVIAAGLGVYIAGLTWFARTEAVVSQRSSLIGAVVVMVGGLAGLAWYPQLASPELPVDQLPGIEFQRWVWLVVLLSLVILWRFAAAIRDPVPAQVQRAIGHGIRSLVILDAAVCASIRGPMWGLVVVSLLIPAMYLGRWIYST